MMRVRNLPMEARERERFLVLSHVINLAGGDFDRAFLCARIADDLALSRPSAAGLFRDLIGTGYLRDVGPGPSVSITPQGVLYLERRAGRRHSVRVGTVPPTGDGGIPSAIKRILGGASVRDQTDTLSSNPAPPG